MQRQIVQRAKRVPEIGGAMRLVVVCVSTNAFNAEHQLLIRHTIIEIVGGKAKAFRRMHMAGNAVLIRPTRTSRKAFGFTLGASGRGEFEGLCRGSSACADFSPRPRAGEGPGERAFSDVELKPTDSPLRFACVRQPAVPVPARHDE